MRWQDERYVRLYTRDTGDWLFLSFDAQALMMMLLRKVDRAGILHLGRHGKEALASIVGHGESHERILAALDQLLVDGCVQLEDEKLIIRNFIEAQETPTSDPQRKRDQRERDRDKLVSEGIRGNSAGLDESAKLSRAEAVKSRGVTPKVTPGHAGAEVVTPSLAVPCLTDPGKSEGGQPENAPAAPQALVLLPQEPLTPLLAYLAAEFPQAKAEPENEKAWAQANPGVDLLAESKKARAWELDNPKRVKPSKRRFLGNWFSTAQGRVGVQPTHQNGHNGTARRPNSPVDAPTQADHIADDAAHRPERPT